MNVLYQTNVKSIELGYCRKHTYWKIKCFDTSFCVVLVRTISVSLKLRCQSHCDNLRPIRNEKSSTIFNLHKNYYELL